MIKQTRVQLHDNNFNLSIIDAKSHVIVDNENDQFVVNQFVANY